MMTASHEESTIDERLNKVDAAIREYLENHYENLSFQVFHEHAHVVLAVMTRSRTFGFILSLMAVSRSWRTVG